MHIKIRYLGIASGLFFVVVVVLDYTLGHIHFDDSVAHAFRWFLRQLWTNFLKI